MPRFRVGPGIGRLPEADISRIFTCRVSLLILLAVVIVGGAFVTFVRPGLYAISESPEFCGSCHVLQMEYEAWFHSGAHRRIKCVDCHLPNDNEARHLFWKAIDGMSDAFAFHTGRVPEAIHISERNSKFVQENCRRCHAETIARITVDRNCWECHRQLSHKLSGVRETRTD